MGFRLTQALIRKLKASPFHRCETVSENKINLGCNIFSTILYEVLVSLAPSTWFTYLNRIPTSILTSYTWFSAMGHKYWNDLKGGLMSLMSSVDGLKLWFSTNSTSGESPWQPAFFGISCNAHMTSRDFTDGIFWVRLSLELHYI